MNKDFKIGLAEVSDILNHMDKSYKDKISKEFLNFIEEHKEKNCVLTLDYSKKLDDMNLNKKTRPILAIIYTKFWCNPQEKKEYLKKLEENEISYQKLLREKYNPDDVIKKRKKTDKK